MSRLLTHWNSIPGKPGFKTIGGQSIFGSGDIAVSDSSKVPYTGATQGLNMGLYDIQATRFQFGSTGPRLDAAVDGTVRVRTNDGLADAPLSASNLTLSGNQIIGNPSGLGPSPYLSAVNSFSEATLELRNSLTNGYTGLNLGSLVASGNITANNFIGALDASYLSGTVPDARLGSNVPLKNAASNAFTGPLDASSFRQTGNTTQALVPSGGVWYFDGTGGFRYRDTSAGYATRFQVDNAGNVTASGIVTATSGFQTHTTNTGFKSTTNGIYCMLDATNGWTLQRQGSNGVIKACNIQETAGVCLDVSTDGTLAIKSRANAVDARLSVPGSFHTVSIGPADATYGAGFSAGNQLLFHSTAYGLKAAIGFNNSGVFLVNGVALGPVTTFNRVECTLGYTYAPAFCTDATSSQEKGMFSAGGVLYLTVNRGNQLAVDGTGVSIAGLLTASGVITSGFRSLSADPTTLDITAGQSQLVKNTTSGEICHWVNDGGTMKKSAALT